jgi:hypothetical protein
MERRQPSAASERMERENGMDIRHLQNLAPKGGCINAVGLQLGIQCLVVDLQEPGGSALVAPGLAQSPLNGLSLYLSHRLLLQ